MEKYASLEQALADPSLAVITGSVATPKELAGLYLKYRALPKRLRRFSDYYSCEFLGHSVPEMYALSRERLNPFRDLFDDADLPETSYIVSEPDLYYREESFHSGETNVCILLGHSGSGKSVMARTIEGDDIDHIELDDLLLIKDRFTLDELMEYSDMYFSFFSGEGAKYYIGVEERGDTPREEYEDRLFVDFVRYALDYAARHRDRKFILDGIWIYLYFDDPSVFEHCTVFIKGTSFLKSKIRVMKREMQRDREELQARKEMFGRQARNYLLDEEKIDRYRSYYGSRPETVFREEDSEAARQQEAVRNQLIAVDRCFVNGDADGITAILKQAEADGSLSNWNKMRLVNECGLALLDLRVSSVIPPLA